MIFKQWELVLSGRKTQTRRLWKSNYAMSFDGGRILAVYNTLTATPLYMESQRLPVIPKRAQPAIRVGGEMARVEVVGLRKERLHDISEADAVAEGVDSVEEYRALWETINGKTKGARWDDNPFVTVITFRRTPELLAALADTTQPTPPAGDR